MLRNDPGLGWLRHDKTDAYRPLLSQKLADYFAFVFVVDPSEEFRAECFDRIRTIKRQLVINFAATEVARLTFRFEDWLDVSSKINFVVR